MARPRSLTLPLSVDRALKRHSCQHDSRHEIAKGDLRLKVTVGRSHEHYCVPCGQKFIKRDINRLRDLEAQLGAPSAE